MAIENSRKLSKEEMDLLLKTYDQDKSGDLSDEEIKKIISDYNEKKTTELDSKIKSVLQKYDKDKDGTLDKSEIQNFASDYKSTDSNARYVGYTVGLSRAFRYLAFTSDFGEALRPVVSPKAVNASYAVAGGYCVVDVAWEAYKLKKRNNRTESGEYMTMTQLIIERSAFQALASIALPFLLIHTTVDITKKVCNKVGRFQKWGPSLAGLAAIPLLPMFLDEPVEHGIEWVFKKYGPWKGEHHEKSE